MRKRPFVPPCHALFAVVALLSPALGCSAPRGEPTGVSRTGSCGCCGTIVDVDDGESCSDPEVCRPYCPPDGGMDGASDGGVGADAGRDAPSAAPG